jgi:hypothetical protein
MLRCALGPGECGACWLCTEATDGDPRNDQLVSGCPRGRQRRGVEFRKYALGFIKAADQEKPSDFEISRVGGIQSIAVLFERHARRIQGLRRPAQIAGCQRNLGLRDDTPGSGYGLLGAEGAHGSPQESLRASEIA